MSPQISEQKSNSKEIVMDLLEQGISKRKISEELGCSDRTIANILSGRVNNLRSSYFSRLIQLYASALNNYNNINKAEDRSKSTGEE